jgi:hypothetical protein
MSKEFWAEVLIDGEFAVTYFQVTLSFMKRHFARSSVQRTCLITLAFVALYLSAHAERLLFADEFDGPTLNPEWQGLFPKAPLPLVGDVTYEGAANYSFEKINGDTVIRLNNTLTDGQRCGWSSSDTFSARQFRLETRFNTLSQAPDKSIDGFIELWIFDATNLSRYDHVSLFGGWYGAQPQFVFGSSINNEGMGGTPFHYENNANYRLVLEGAPDHKVVAILLTDEGKELMRHEFSHTSSEFASGFKLGLSQAMGTPRRAASTDVAVDFVHLTTTDRAALSVQTEKGWIHLHWPSLAGTQYQIQYSANVSGGPWSDLGDPIRATDAKSSLIMPSPSEGTLFYRVSEVQ